MGVFPGLAHLSNRPFGRSGMWGFPWRENREFVGQFSYGVGYTLWNPVGDVHRRFPAEFRQAVMTCLLCAQRPASPLHYVQNEVVFYIFNMCRYDWFGTAAAEGGSSQSRHSQVEPLSMHSIVWNRRSVLLPDNSEDTDEELAANADEWPRGHADSLASSSSSTYQSGHADW